MGSQALALLAQVVFRDARAVLEVLAVGANPIGSEGGSTLLEAVKASSLKIIDIGKPLPIQEPYESDSLDLSKTNMGPGQVVILSWWLATSFSAVLARVSVLSNPIDTDGADALIQVFEQNTKLRTLLGIEEGVNELNLSEKNVDPGQAKILAAELKASRATAVLTKLALGGNLLLGNRDVESEQEYDAHGDQMPFEYEGFNMLCESLKTSPLTEVDLSDCRLDASATTTLAKAIELMTTLAWVDIRGADVEEAVLETLRAVAPEGCEVVWEPP